MTKPVNNFAVMMWVAAALVPIVNVLQVSVAVAALKYAAGDTIFLLTRGFLTAISGSFAPGAMLVGLGGLIEIVDQIRWQVEQRAQGEPKL